MLQTISRRALLSVVALALVAGCSNSAGTTGGTSLTPGTNAAGAAVRYVKGPDVSGPIAIPLVRAKSNARVGWPDKKKKSILFVADCSLGILMYDPTVPNSGPTGSITSGTDCTFGVAVDKKGNLYSVNLGGNTLQIYAKGSTSPTTTITNGIDGPYGVTVDSKGNVFVTNLNNNTVTGYAKGQTTAFETIDFNAYGQAVGIGVDKKNNVWVACDSSNAVFEIAAGTQTVTNAGLTGLSGPIGISFGQKDEIFVSSFATDVVQVYKYGTTSPFESLNSGISGPTQNGVTHAGTFFQSNQDVNVVGFKKGQTSPFSALTGTSEPAGVAAWPLVKK
ncbi:MAG TPA: hypothetical protein VHX17_12645 [Candidatus Cybelea sp.]|nr:hypothetical protein [Candidatus Cybelea sp.]